MYQQTIKNQIKKDKQMENTKITITPLYLSYTHGHPHPHKQQLSVLLKFKRILHSTGYELEKYQCKKTFPFPHNSSINSNNPDILDLKHYRNQTSINFQLVREMELSNTRVDIIVIGLLNLGKDVNLLGIVSLDLGLFEDDDWKKGEFKKQMNVKLDKCEDPGAFMHIEVCLKDIEKPKRADYSKKNNNVQNMGMFETQGFGRQQMIMNRRKNRDMPTAYQISHRNYKQVQITRTEQFTVSPETKANEKLQRSYKKRFQYQYEVSSKRIAKNTSNNKGISKVNKTGISTQRNSPSPRLKTPQPIKQSSVSKRIVKQISKGSAKGNNTSYQNMAKNKTGRKKESISKSHVTQRPLQRDQNHCQYSEHEDQRQDNQSHPPSYIDSSFEEGQAKYEDKNAPKRTQKRKVEESPNIETVKDNKFRMITQKLERIQKRIMSKTPGYQDKSQPQIKSFDHFGENRSSEKNQKQSNCFRQFSDQEEQQIPRQPIKPLPYEQQQSEGSQQNVYQSQVAHFSPKDSSKFNKQGPQKQKTKEGVKIYESEPIPIISPSKGKKLQSQKEVKQIQNQQKMVKVYKQQDSPLMKKSKIQRDFSNEQKSIKNKNSLRKNEDNSVKEPQNIVDEFLPEKPISKQQNSPISQLKTKIKENANNKELQYNQAQRQQRQRLSHKVIQNHDQCEEKIIALQNQLQEQQQKHRKLMMEKELDCKNRVKSEQEKIKDQLMELQNLRQQTVKQKKLADKLNQMYQESDDKNFELSKEYQKKYLEFQRKFDALTKTNQGLTAQLQTKQKQIQKYLKKMADLQSQLAQIKQKMATMVKAQNQRILQEKQHFGNMEEKQRQSKKSDKSEKGHLSNTSSISCSQDNFKEGYISAKKKCVNLQAQIKYKENEIRFLRIKNDNLLQEKKDLENEIDMIAANNKLQMARQGSISKMNLESQSITNSFKLENKALKEEILNLQRQVHELNQILQGLIKMDQLSMKNAMKKDYERKKHQEELNDVVLYKKYKAQEQKAQAYAEELRVKQETIAKIINLVWSYGSRPLMEQIGKLITENQ